jgi:two-component system response regulator PilR (NtrC family)
MVADGTFREDLYYRLNVIPLRLPALRERADDVPIIAEHFLQKFTREMGKPIHGFTSEATALLAAYEWPGNVRELENVVERAVALERGETITAQTLGDHLRNSRRAPAGSTDRQPETLPGSGFNLEHHLQEIERAHVEQALKQAGGVQVRAADLLGLSFRQFRYLVKKYAVRAQDRAS